MAAKPKTTPATNTTSAATPGESSANARAPAHLPRAPGPAVRITAAVDGVFACGQRHPAAPRDYRAGHFSARQVAEMSAMLLLHVERIEH
jgi:hypothetical protein